ncbi:MAG TPA: 50S ribosomal protein L4 [Actinomycetota bacterium]
MAGEARPVDVLDSSGKKVGEHQLDPAIFDVEINVPVMHQVVVAGAASQRAGTHSTKTRAEVRGGGKKPWRQKGTGRSRHGSSRSPIWVGGGISHGPKPRDHSTRVNKKMRRLALRSALTDRARGGRIRVIDGIGFDSPKTAQAAALLRALELEGRVLLVVADRDENMEKSFRNLPNVKIDHPRNLSTFDTLYADFLVFTKEALEAVKP